ncbi:MAG: cation-binding protein [Desulfatitalea sp. BRH_c12]|nr:MAG: cation-binding protein [Desulfatitalea sp. BRH_c12]
MQSRGPLMIEHRLIARMIALFDKALKQIDAAGKVDPVFIDTVVDFMRFYADRTHHGKEEDLLFQELRKRSLSAEDEKIMNELIEEHALGRRTTQALVDANIRYRSGDAAALSDIMANLRKLVAFYPGHIVKEDRIFFPSSRTYFTDEEDQAMLSAYWEFDRKMVHEKYNLLVKEMEKQNPSSI